MRPIDFGKAALAGLLVLALNLLATTAVIFAWAMLVEPGRSQDYYNTLAPRIGSVTGPLGGVVLMLGAAYLLGRRRPGRNAMAFAGAVWAAYALLDVASALPMMALADLMTIRLGLSLLAALAAGLLGATLAVRRNRATPASG